MRGWYSVEGMLVDGRRGKKEGRGRCWWELKEGSGEEGMERNNGKTKWKEKLQKTVVKGSLIPRPFIN